MGNKQSNSDLFNKNQPRNVFSLYGPKASTVSSPSQSLQSSMLNDNSFCELDKEKQKLRLSRAHRNTRQDGFQVNKNPESIVKSVNFITKYIHLVQTLNVDANILEESFLKYELATIFEELNSQQNNQEIQNIEQNQVQNRNEHLNSYENEDYSMEQQSPSQIYIQKKNKEPSIKVQDEINNQDIQEGKVRPTAYFGWIAQQESNQNQQEMPELKKKDTFGELSGGIQITNQQSFEDPDFAAAPCRQTAFFGDLERQSQLKGFYKQLASRYQPHDELFQDIQSQQQKEVKEEDDEEDNSDEENNINNNKYRKDPLNSQNVTVQKMQQQPQHTDSDDNDEPVHITIDLSAKKKKGRSQLANQNKPLVINIQSDKLKQKEQNSTSKSPKSDIQTKNKPTWKPTSPHLISSNGSNSDKNSNKNDTKQNEKSPIKIDSRKKSASFVVINKQEKMQREKNKSQDFQKDILTIDNKIEKLNNDIEVLDLIKKDIAKVQNKIIRDMSPSYRQNQNQQK
ncbi:hypothetical protein TTHERM_00294980 (macronuclear) [Tetrahymena thermophila SB210]|uniref:Uncharacterized protein n=1 Tax=Tetrahymena thermophila (strain SB210) TaxID=312017 RepID=I7MIC5_TETTS|nr:hypothetical protein TTHERM_00294980 [Tetrahymena thermophila SB210]EAR92885.2 hypothetical protein TTHERM_00294980 [Tetrahymena thermophila SB210]|eukprot:XP_001013130.2 hypothetical protein TTHERM_00294980 [Tetrahymena thermophila SB210]